MSTAKAKYTYAGKALKPKVTVKVGGKTTTYYSDWSKAKAVKTRK